MKNLNLSFEDDEYEKLLRNKGNRTWKEMLMDAPVGYKMEDTVHHEKGDFTVVSKDDATFWTVGNNKGKDLPVHPNQIMVYTLYTLEKVE